MVEVSDVFQQPKFQSLCHDLLFHCRFLFVFCLGYFKQTVILIMYSFFMFYSMVDKCMTLLQKFSVFWWQANQMEIYIVLINTHQPGKITTFFSADDWIFSCYVIWIMDDVIRATFCGFNDYCSGSCRRER